MGAREGNGNAVLRACSVVRQHHAVSISALRDEGSGRVFAPAAQVPHRPMDAQAR
jgi:hypothetical protein